MATISERIWSADQSWNYERVHSTEDGQRLRTTIRRNAYDNQSYGKVERWDGAKWQIVLTRTIDEMEDRVRELSYTAHRSQVHTDLFSASALLMEVEAEQIVT